MAGAAAAEFSVRCGEPGLGGTGPVLPPRSVPCPESQAFSAVGTEQVAVPTPSSLFLQGVTFSLDFILHGSDGAGVRRVTDMQAVLKIDVHWTLFFYMYDYFTMLYSFLLYNKVNHLYVHIYPLFFRFFSHIGITEH